MKNNIIITQKYENTPACCIPPNVMETLFQNNCKNSSLISDLLQILYNLPLSAASAAALNELRRFLF